MSVIQCFSKGQNVNVLNILHVHRIRFRTVLVDTHVPERRRVPRCYTKLIWWKKCHSSFVKSEWNVPPMELGFFLSAQSRAVSSHLYLHETIDYSVSNCFMNIKMQSNIINVETCFRHANHSAEVVSGRLLRFHIPKFHRIPVTCWCLLPSDLVNMS